MQPCSPQALIPTISSKRAASAIIRAWTKKFNRTPDGFIFQGPQASGLLGFKEAQLEKAEQEGYYAVLFLNDGSKAFAFFDNSLEVAYWTTGLVYDRFPTKAQMDNLLTTLAQQGSVTLDRITESIGYPLGEPFSSSTNYGYIIQEGILLMDFKRVYSPDVDRILASTEFVSNEDWSAKGDKNNKPAECLKNKDLIKAYILTL